MKNQPIFRQLIEKQKRDVAIVDLAWMFERYGFVTHQMETADYTHYFIRVDRCCRQESVGDTNKIIREWKVKYQWDMNEISTKFEWEQIAYTSPRQWSLVINIVFPPLPQKTRFYVRVLKDFDYSHHFPEEASDVPPLLYNICDAGLRFELLPCEVYKDERLMDVVELDNLCRKWINGIKEPIANQSNKNETSTERYKEKDIRRYLEKFKSPEIRNRVEHWFVNNSQTPADAAARFSEFRAKFDDLKESVAERDKMNGHKYIKSYIHQLEDMISSEKQIVKKQYPDKETTPSKDIYTICIRLNPTYWHGNTFREKDLARVFLKGQIRVAEKKGNALMYSVYVNGTLVENPLEWLLED